MIPIAPTKTLVVTTSADGTPVLAEPVRLVNEDGTPFKPGSDAPTTIPQGALAATAPLTATRNGDGMITVALPDGSITAAKLAKGVIPTIPATPTWATISGKPAPAAAISDLTAAPAAADVNKILAALRTFGVIAAK